MVDIQECDRCGAICESVAEQLEQPLFRWSVALRRALRAQISGDVELADRLATEALEIGNDAGMPDAMLYFAGQAWGVHHQRGNLADLIPILEEMNADSLDVAGLVASGLAIAYASVGRLDDAARMLRAVADTEFDINQDTAWLQALVNFSEVAHAVADQSAATELLELLVSWADQWVLMGDVLATGPVPYYLGCLTIALGRDEEAEDWFARSAVMCERMGAKFWAARTNLRLGELLAARDRPGDAEKARSLLDDAHAAATANEYGSIERESAEALQHLK
jgi:tetratricopeptide (TPR) repeat protein